MSMQKTDELEKLDAFVERLEVAEKRLRAVAQGRVYVVGTKVTFDDKFGIITHLNQGSEDPLASTVDLRLQDGTTINDVSVTSVALQLLRQ